MAQRHRARPKPARAARPALALVACIVFACPVFVAGCTGADADGPRTLTLGIAASLRRVTPALIEAYRAGHTSAPPMVFDFGSSGSMRLKVQAGAPLDLVLLASTKEIAQLTGAQLVDQPAVAVATNRLVLIGPADGRPFRFATLAANLRPGERLAVGEPGSVPAGRYAKRLLTELGAWDALVVNDRLVFGAHVGQVLAYAKRGEVPAAIVYATEARGVDRVVIRDRAPDLGLPCPQVVGAVVSASPQADVAHDFLAFVASPAGQAILRAHGFGPAVPEDSPASSPADSPAPAGDERGAP